MAVSRGEPVLLHMHVAKTAGQSINMAMRERHRGRTAGLTEPAELRRFLDLTPRQRDGRFDLVRGHLVTWGLHKYFERRTVYVSVMREPMARICSLFNYVHTRPQHPRHNEFKRRYPSIDDFTVEDFAQDWMSEYFSNAYWRFYTGGTTAPGDVGPEAERLREAIASRMFICGPLEVVAEALHGMGRLDYPVPRENPTVFDGTTDFVPARPQTLRPRVRALLEAENAADLTLYAELSRTWAGR